MQAFVPYLKVKLERLYSRLTSENDAVQIRWCRGQGAKLLMKYLIFKLIPYFQFLWTVSRPTNSLNRNIGHLLLFFQVCAFVFGLRYLISGAQFYSPLLWIAGQLYFSWPLSLPQPWLDMLSCIRAHLALRDVIYRSEWSVVWHGYCEFHCRTKCRIIFRAVKYSGYIIFFTMWGTAMCSCRLIRENCQCISAMMH